MVQVLSLTALVRRLGLVAPGGEEKREETGAALARIADLADEGWVREDTASRMRDLYEYRRQRFAARGSEQPEGAADGYEERSLAYQRFRQ